MRDRYRMRLHDAARDSGSAAEMEGVEDGLRAASDHCHDREIALTLGSRSSDLRV
jgi:hypothetical protein